MGNRATVIFTDGTHRFSPAIYLHWNGGPESVYPFLDELDRRGIRPDQNYEAARFVAIVCEFFDREGYGGLSVGVSNGPKDLWDLDRVATDHGDNGFYLVDRTGEYRKVRRFTESVYFNATGDPFYHLDEWTPEQVDEEYQDTIISQTGQDYAREIGATYAHKEVRS